MSRPVDLPPTVDCPYCLARIDTSRARSVIRDIATQEVKGDVTDVVRQHGLIGVAPYNRGNTYLECTRRVRLDPTSATGYGAGLLDEPTTVVVGGSGDGEPTTAFTGGIDFDDPDDEPTGSPLSLDDDVDGEDDGDGWESSTGTQPRPVLPTQTDENELPDPHYLPYEYCQIRRTLNIGLIGTTRSGKSHLLAAMLYRLREEERRLARLGVHVEPFAEMWEHYMQREDIAGFLAPDRRTALRRTNRTDPVEFRMAYTVTSTWNGEPTDCVVSFFDVAGELFLDAKARRRLQFIYGLDAYIFVADSQALYGWDGKRRGLLHRSGFDEVINQILQNERHMAHATKQRRETFLPKPAVVVLAKADLLLAQNEYWTSRWLERDDDFELETVDEESEDVYVYCATNGAREWLKPVSAFEDATLHFTSATGCEERDGHYNKRKFRHMRVLRPLLALFAMTGIIDPKTINHAYVPGVRDPR
ncbi:hypothetical protein [Thermobifida cellulosilytica]|uniref:Uncharacterized protein n=1 Tax=Thermobifida cellulosilytica TB100 TaxID=665004 RepID=A0A147KFP0_THECS|nr:hypothetical protein [Thermobifida cellulosilytica]KUP96126.1 hypothetical protein AC529_13830 [Thermobifida cellulosilytica TB100]